MFNRIKQMFCNHDYILGDILHPPYGFMTEGDYFQCKCEKCGKEVQTFLTNE
jgi:hypothetical protein